MQTHFLDTQGTKKPGLAFDLSTSTFLSAGECLLCLLKGWAIPGAAGMA